MIQVIVPNNNISERKYILDIVLSDFLGVQYSITIDNVAENWEICLANGLKLTINDLFFNRHMKDLSYINEINLPENIFFSTNSFAPEPDLPILFGSGEIVSFDDKIICDIDIFASCFFMLARWEEYVNKTRDSHNRFPAYESLAYKFGFLDRPIVNEYVQMLKNMLIFLDKNIKFKTHKSQMFVTCDVDNPFDHTVRDCKILLRTCLGDIIKRRSILECASRVRRYFFNKFCNYKYDKNYTFDWYMDVCEANNLKASFYFIPTSKEPQNGCYELSDKNIQDLMIKIHKRGHKIGVHGSYQTFNDFKKTKIQKELFQDVLNKLNISQADLGNRQHYLRWDSSITPAILNDADFTYDTSGSYADMAGFRYGTCYEFEMFDFLNRKRLNLKERPLIVMDCSVLDKKYMGLDEKDAIEFMLLLMKKCKKYQGNFVLLWHNSYFQESYYKNIFTNILKGWH